MYKNRPLRMDGYDYSSSGKYFVTINTKPRIDWFGEIIEGTIKLNEFGYIANQFWKLIPSIHSNVNIYEYVIMPDHVHGIVEIMQNDKRNDGVDGERFGVEVGQCPTSTHNHKNYKLLSKIVNGYKGAVTKTLRNSHHLDEFGWQRSFWDRIIRDELEFKRIKNYIIENPKNYYAKR